MRSIASGKSYPMRPVVSSPGAAQSALPGLRVHRRLRAVARTDAQHRLREIISNAPCGELPGGGASALPGLRVHRRLRAVARTDAQHRLREIISNAPCGELPGGGAKRLARATGSSPSASGSPDKASAAIREPYPMRPVVSSPGRRKRLARATGQQTAVYL